MAEHRAAVAAQRAAVAAQLAWVARACASAEVAAHRAAVAAHSAAVAAHLAAARNAFFTESFCTSIDSLPLGAHSWRIAFSLSCSTNLPTQRCDVRIGGDVGGPVRRTRTDEST